MEEIGGRQTRKREMEWNKVITIKGLKMNLNLANIVTDNIHTPLTEMIYGRRTWYSKILQNYVELEVVRQSL